MSRGAREIRVLIVDDSALVRKLLEEGFRREPDLKVVGTARDPYEARDLLVQHRPDVMTLDVEMPRMDGVTFLRKVMAVIPTPTVVLSSLTAQGSQLALAALEAGAVDVVQKPSSALAVTLEGMLGDLTRRVKQACLARLRQPTATMDVSPVDIARLAHTTDRVIGLGASAGGVAALGRILPAFPVTTPGIVIVQHMAAGFTREFAERLHRQCQMKVAEAKHGDRVLKGQILVAPGGERHLEVRRFGGEYRVHLIAKPPVSGHVPSVDVFFDSLSEHAGRNAAACLMTGMGTDGAMGLLRLRSRGGATLAQDKDSCVVWGMPAAAQALGAAERFVPLERIPATLVEWAGS